MEQNSSINKVKIIVTFLIISSVLFLINYVSYGENIRNAMSYIYNPFTVSSYKAGLESANYFKLFSNVTKINNENEKLKAEVIKLRAEKSEQMLLAEENSQLKKLQALGYKDVEFKMVNMFIDDTNKEDGFILLGKLDGIENGSVLQYGGVYAGTVYKTTQTTSVIRLPISSASSLKVSIIKAFNWDGVSQKNIDNQVKSAFKANAVAIGKNGEVVVQNIKADAGVTDGDLVVVNDQRINRHLILGKVKGLDKNPALASVNAKVSLLVDYASLNTYFIEIK